MDVIVTELTDGEIGVRDYIVKKAINKKDVLNIHLDEETMSMDPHSLIEKRTKVGNIQQSKFNKDQWYYVWYYKWEPNLVNND